MEATEVRCEQCGVKFHDDDYKLGDQYNTRYVPCQTLNACRMFRLKQENHRASQRSKTW